MKHRIIFSFALMMMPMFANAEQLLIVARHGQALNNVREINNSNPSHSRYFPYPLTDVGRKQAEESGRSLTEKGITSDSVEVVFVSPLPRAMETAEIFAKAGVCRREQIIIEPRLIESCCGDLEGLSYGSFPTGDCWDLSMGHQYGGETDEDVKNRVQTLYEEVKTRYQKGHVIFISHGSPARELIGVITGSRDILKTAEARILPLR